MKNLVFTALIGTAMLSGACSGTRKTTTASEQPAMEINHITGIKWRLIELYGRPVAALINHKEPYILLQDTANRYAASAGCNALSGTFTLSGHKGKRNNARNTLK